MRRYPRLLACLPLLAGTACASAVRPPADPAPEPRSEPRIGLGSPQTFTVRLRETVPPGSPPLYVVDGIEVQEAPVHLEQKDIASIRILQGEDAVAAYGSRGAHGVLLITTRRDAADPRS